MVRSAAKLNLQISGVWTWV